jgi:hypothetical protein
LSSEGVRLQSWPRKRRSWLRFFVVSWFPSCKCRDCAFKLAKVAAMHIVPNYRPIIRHGIVRVTDSAVA